jgi:hypothetical protein
LDTCKEEGKVEPLMLGRLKSAVVILAIVGCSASIWAQSVLLAAGDQPGAGPDQKNPPVSTVDASRVSPGSISGTIVDQSGAVVAGARVKLTADGQAQSQQALSGSDGQFFFPSVTPGTFQLAITSAGFATQTFSGTLHPGEVETLPQIAMNVADARIEVQVGLTQVEVAEEEIKYEEKQRVLGVIPNFYVSYIPNAAPLDAKQKFKLAFRTMIDPFTFVVVAGTAGVEQAQNHFAEYGQGAQGYAKRFAANYGDATTGTLIGAAILPALLKQDPRYFYKGTGSVPSRAAYAIANSVICKGDNGRWQPNYSNVLGSLAAGGISNLYYPEQDRNGAGLTVENGAIGIGATAISNLFQEFIVKKLTPKLSRNTGTP